MTEAMECNRWYDKDPTVSLAVSLFKNTDPNNQQKVAEFIIQKGLKHNIIIGEKSMIENFKGFFRRWYDNDYQLFQALEYLRFATPKIRKELALDVINYLCNIESI